MSIGDPVLRDALVISSTSQLVAVNPQVCRCLARLITGWNVPADREEVSLTGLSRKEIGNFFFLLVSICHQTSPTGKPLLEGIVSGKYRRGWDYLAARLEEQVRQDRSLLFPETWCALTPERLDGLFRDREYGSRLTSVTRRAELVCDLGLVMKTHGWEWVDDVYDAANHRVAEGEPNLLQLLSIFRAYSDPVRKKSSFFLSLMRNSGLWAYVDEANLGPPVDYHEVRGHLRIGTVCVMGLGLRDKLLHRRPVGPDEDIAIRGAVFNAIMLLSRESSPRTPSQLHYLFWNVFRSCCTREEPHCHVCKANCDLPPQYVPLAIQDEWRRCPFASVCASANLTHRYYDHVFETDYY